MAITIKKGTKIIMSSGLNGINVRADTELGRWKQKRKMILEAPVRFGGGKISLTSIGAFTYINDDASIRADSIGIDWQIRWWYYLQIKLCCFLKRNFASAN